jgi:hypothetical protein
LVPIRHRIGHLVPCLAAINRILISIVCLLALWEKERPCSKRYTFHACLGQTPWQFEGD